MKDKKAAIGFIFITLILDITGMGIIIPIMPDLIKELIHGDIAEAAEWGGWLMTAYALMQFVFAPIVGSLSDKYGRRPILLLSLLGFGLDFILLALAPSIWWLFVGRMIAGIMGASITTASAYISDISNDSNRAQNFGMIGAAFGIGFILGPLIGGILGDYGVRLPFWAAAGISFINLIYGYFVLPESLAKEDRSPFRWKKANPIGNILHFKHFPMVIGMMLLYFLFMTGSQSVNSVWSYYTKEKFEWSNSMIGISLSVVGVLVGVVQGFLTKHADRKLGSINSIYIGLGLYAIGNILFAFATESYMMFLFLIPYCLGGIAGPAFQNIITRQVPRNEQGALQGGLTSSLSLSNIVGPFIMSHIFSYFSVRGTEHYFPGAPYILGGVLFILSFLLFHQIMKKVNNKPIV